MKLLGSPRVIEEGFNCFADLAECHGTTHSSDLRSDTFDMVMEGARRQRFTE